MIERLWIGFAALAGATGTAADVAFRHLVSDADRVGLGLIASRYGIYHALALIAAALLRQRLPSSVARSWVSAAGWCFVVGEILFCGPLYLIGAGLAGWSGRFIIPGLVVLVGGWLALLIHAVTPRQPV